MTRPDHYATLGVTKDASLADIKRAYRKLAREAHPDNGGTTERMQELNAAKEVLYDAQRRADYDAGGDGGVDPIEAKANSLLIDLFMEAIAVNALNPFQATIGGLRKGIGECRAKIQMQYQAIKRMQAQRGRIIARKSGKNAYSDIITAATETAEGSIRNYEQQIAVAEMAIKLLNEEYEPAPVSDSFYQEQPAFKEPFVPVEWKHDSYKF